MDQEQTRDLLKLTEADRRAILHQIESDAIAAGFAKRRGAERMSVPSNVRLRVTFTGLNGHTGAFWCVPRDLSETGIGFLHGGFVHKNTKVVAELTAPDGTSLAMHGSVTDCAYVSGRCHQVGVRFDNRVDISMFIAAGMFAAKDSAPAATLNEETGAYWQRLRQICEELTSEARQRRDITAASKLIVNLNETMRSVIAGAKRDLAQNAPGSHAA
jgi:hypothetical protein